MVGVLDGATASGLSPRSLAVSGTPGTHGNVEFLLWCEVPGPGDQEVVGGSWHSELLDVSNSFWDGEDGDALDL